MPLEQFPGQKAEKLQQNVEHAINSWFYLHSTLAQLSISLFGITLAIVLLRVQIRFQSIDTLCRRFHDRLSNKKMSLQGDQKLSFEEQLANLNIAIDTKDYSALRSLAITAAAILGDRDGANFNAAITGIHLQLNHASDRLVVMRRLLLRFLVFTSYEVACLLAAPAAAHYCPEYMPWLNATSLLMFATLLILIYSHSVIEISP